MLPDISLNCSINKFTDVQQRLSAEQNEDYGDTDYIFEVPVELFRGFTGRYDRDPDCPWEILERS